MSYIETVRNGALGTCSSTQSQLVLTAGCQQPVHATGLGNAGAAAWAGVAQLAVVPSASRTTTQTSRRTTDYFPCASMETGSHSRQVASRDS